MSYIIIIYHEISNTYYVTWIYLSLYIDSSMTSFTKFIIIFKSNVNPFYAYTQYDRNDVNLYLHKYTYQYKLYLHWIPKSLRIVFRIYRWGAATLAHSLSRSHKPPTRASLHQFVDTDGRHSPPAFLWYKTSETVSIVWPLQIKDYS